ncbi:MAG: AAA family ATPase [Zavarzinella sp.]|nr:AAA family ATPase [Zavarzinella sp.]
MIKKIRIQNFRSLRDVTVQLDPVTVLIGRSGTGKSNFVSAVRFLRDCLNSRQIDFHSQGGIHRILHVDYPKDPLVYELEFKIDSSGPEYRYTLLWRQPDGELDESLRVGDRTLFHRLARKWIVAPEVVPVPPPTGIMLGAIPGLQESTFAYVRLRSGIGCYDFPGTVLTGPGNQGNPIDRGFADRGDNYLFVAEQVLSDLSKARNWNRISRSMRAVNRAVASLTLNVPTPDRLDVGHQLNGRLLSMDVRLESEGFRRYLAHILAMYQNPAKQTLLFEHPESGLHPGALESLAHEFKTCPKENRGQVILTTHSPQLLDYFPPESLRVVDVEKLETRIGPVAPEQMESLRERLLQPGELLTVDPARLPGQLAEVPG